MNEPKSELYSYAWWGIGGITEKLAANVFDTHTGHWSN